MSPQIVALRGPLAGGSYSLASVPLCFGRAPENSVIVVSPLASRRQAEVRPAAGAYLHYDPESSNGTRVNGQAVSVHRLSPGDDDTDKDALSLPELGAALATARERSGYASFDLIGFDARLMAQRDVFEAIRPYGPVVVTSAEMAPNQGWAWDTWLGALADDPTQDARAIAPAIVEAYVDAYTGSDAEDITLAAFALTQVSGLGLTRRVDELSSAMVADMGGSYGLIAQARSIASSYAPTSAETFNTVDPGHVAALQPGQGTMAAAAADLLSALGQVRLANGAGAYHSTTSRISAYIPADQRAVFAEYERGSPLPGQTGWDGFPKAFHTALSTLA